MRIERVRANIRRIERRGTRIDEEVGNTEDRSE